MFFDKIVDAVEDLALSCEEDDKQILQEMRAYESDSNLYRRNPDFLDPLYFWSQKGSLYPNLYMVALKLLPVPATSVLSEQVFSGAGRIASKDRT